MLEQLNDLPVGVIGFEAVGEVHGSDYEATLSPAVDTTVEEFGEVRLVYVLGPRFSRYTGGAAWADTKFGLGSARHTGAFKRTAIVSDVDWVDHLAAAFGWMMPGKFRRFALADLSDAVTWVAADD